MNNWENYIGRVNCMDCMDLMKEMPDQCVDLIVTDPPYPDYYEEKYFYNPETIKMLDKFKCKQFIFWTAKEDFLLNYSAVHIWDKMINCASHYERIFERNGQENYKIFHNYTMNSRVAASFQQDFFTGHKSQKPLKLIKKIIKDNSKEGDLIFDPFMGSWTTARACEDLHRRWIGCEISPEYCKIGENRLKQQVLL